MDRVSARDALLPKLARLAGAKARRIQDDTEIYYDLGLFGDDLDELIEWLGTTFRIDFSSMDIREFGPEEPGDFVPRFGDRWLGRRPYKSLKVCDLIQAIDSRRWSRAA